MGASKHIRTALAAKDLKMIDLYNRLHPEGDSPIQSLYNQVNRDTWKFADVEKIADLLGCDVLLVDRETGRTY